MHSRVRLALVVLVVLIAANLGWRLWVGWGLITVDADAAPLAEVTGSIAKQAGVQLVSTLPAETKVTMHVRQVTLERALQVLSNNVNAGWSLGYFSAPDKAAIRTALLMLADGETLSGWKKFAFAAPPMGGFGAMAGATDSRADRWEPAASTNLHGYLEQASQAVDAQFWVPEDWNPAVTAAPKAGRLTDVVRKLAGSAAGTSAEVFLLTARGSGAGPGQPGVANAATPAGSGPGAPPGGGGGGFPGGGPPNAAMREMMEKRMRAAIDKMPAEKKAAALAEFEERRKFFEELAKLPEEERREKVRERIEQDMQSGRMESRMTQFEAARTAEQRANFFRMVLKHKADAAK